MAWRTLAVPLGEDPESASTRPPPGIRAAPLKSMAALFVSEVASRDPHSVLISTQVTSRTRQSKPFPSPSKTVVQAEQGRGGQAAVTFAAAGLAFIRCSLAQTR